MNKNKSTNTAKKASIISNTALEGYDASVMMRMNGRCGAATSKGSKGIALEIMDVDKQNFEAALKHTGEHTSLAQNPHDPFADAYRRNSDGTVTLISYKNCTGSGKYNVVQDINNNRYAGEYRSTTEGAKAVNDILSKNGMPEQVIDTKISAKDTDRIANIYTHQVPKFDHVIHAANNSGQVGAAISGAVAVLDTASNDGTIGECVESGVSKGAEGYVTAAASRVVGEAGAGLVSSALAGLGVLGTVTGVGVGIAAGAATAKLVGEVVDGAFDDVAATVGNAVDDAKFNAELAADTLSETVKGTAAIIGDIGEYTLDAANAALESSSAAISDFTDTLGDRICDGIDNFFFGLECLFGL